MIRILIGTILLVACGPGAPEAPVAPEPITTATCWADRDCRRPLIVSHRGEGLGEPENTIASIRACAAAGVDAVEIDPRLTRDGRYVLMHDDGLGRTTSAEGNPMVETMDFEAVRDLTIKDPRCTSPQIDPERCQVPTLEEALQAAAGGTVLMLDIKAVDVDALIQTLQNHGGAATSFAYDPNETLLDALEAGVPGLLTMSRAQDPTTARDIINRRQPVLLHADPDYVGEIAADAAAAKVKLLVDLFLITDPFLWAHQRGEPGQWDLARDAIATLMADSPGILQTNYPIELRTLLEELRP